jgi:hypothetical protein
MEHAIASKIRNLKRNGYAISGVTHDGVVILKSPRGRSKLTDKQISAAVAAVRSPSANSLAGSVTTPHSKRK